MGDSEGRVVVLVAEVGVAAVVGVAEVGVATVAVVGVVLDEQ